MRSFAHTERTIRIAPNYRRSRACDGGLKPVIRVDFRGTTASDQSRSYKLAAANVRSWEKLPFGVAEPDDRQRALISDIHVGRFRS